METTVDIPRWVLAVWYARMQYLVDFGNLTGAKLEAAYLTCKEIEQVEREQ